MSTIPQWAVLDAVTDCARAYLESIDTRRVAPTSEAVAALQFFDTPIPDGPTAPEQIIDELDRVATPATVAISGPRYFGFVNGGSLPAAVAVNWLSTAWDQHGAFRVGSPATTKLEHVAARWILELLGLPSDCGVGFVTGTTVGHVTCLAAARDTVLEHAGWDARANGLFGAPPIAVVVGDEGHSTLFKALGILGLGRTRVVRVPVDAQGRMRAGTLPRIDGPSILCLQAGNVNTGAFDPFAEIIERARGWSVPPWVHIDGAFGIWARVAPARAHLTAGIELADSWSTDAHKWLNCPYDSGIAIVRDAGALRRTMSLNAAYLPSEENNPSDFTPEASRRSRGVDAWAAIRSLGRSGLADLVERNCRLAKRFADGFTAAGYAVLNDVVLNQVMVSFGEPERTRQIVAAVQDDGTCWCGPTVWHGQTAMRVSVISWATTEADVDASLEAILRVASS